MAVEVPLSAFKRVPYVEPDGCTWAFVGYNWVGATFLMHIRNRYGDTGTPIISLAGASAGSEGISVSYDADYSYTDPVSGQTVTAPASLVLVQIDEATLEALSLGTPVDAPVELVYDLHVTPSGGVKRVAVFGTFSILPGSTI